jgi:hypothetical protein
MRPRAPTAAMIDAKTRPPLVVVALGAAAREDYTIDLARGLAPSDAPELLGLFVEDAELLAHARSRWAREILLTGEERGLDRGSLERQLRSQATQARTRFETVTTRLGLRHRFEVARGNVLAEMLRHAAAAEALVVSLRQVLGASGVWPHGLARQFIGARLPRVLLAREGWRTGQSIAVLLAAADPASPVLASAARLARQIGSPLTLLLPVTEGQTSSDIVRRAEEALAAYGVVKSDIVLLGGTGVAGIALAARACRARLLVMPSPDEAGEAEMIDDLMRRFSGALMLVRH